MTREEMIEAIGKAMTAEKIFRLHDRLVRHGIANGREDFLAIEKMMTERLYCGEVEGWQDVVPAAGFIPYL